MYDRRAAGDALGVPVEFFEENTIFKTFGENGITQYSLCNGKALISDDTQMSLFTADGLLCAERRFVFPVIDNYVSCVYESYLSWLSTQESDYVFPEWAERSALLQVEELHARRAPGHTCLSALRSGICGSFENRINNSKGCGGVMRVAPVAVFLAQKDEMPLYVVDNIAARVAAITHGNVLGYMPAAFLAHVLGEIIRGASLTSAVQNARTAVRALFGNGYEIEYFDQLIEKAVGLAGDKDVCDDLDAIRQIGEGWVAEETVAIAVYCSLRYPKDFDKALIASVNHSGDSDSTGAVTGNIMGTLLGYNKIPTKYTDCLESKELLLSVAERMIIKS